MSRAGFAFALAGALVLGALADRVVANRIEPTGTSTPAEKPIARASTPDLRACATARDTCHASLARCLDTTRDAPRECPVCPAPQMPGMTPEEEARAATPELLAAMPMYAACNKERHQLRGKLARCVRGEPEPEEPVLAAPVRSREEERELLFRSYDYPIQVTRVDGTVRIYGPKQWPPPEGVGEGNRVTAVSRMVDGALVWGPPDAPGRAPDGGGTP